MSEQLTHKDHAAVIQYVILKPVGLKDDPSFCFGSVDLNLKSQLLSTCM